MRKSELYRDMQRRQSKLFPFLHMGVESNNKRRRFNVLDREQVRARAEMAESEDTKVLSAISTATTTATGRNTTVTSSGGLTRATLAALFAEIEQHDAPVANIIMHPINYKDIRGWAKDEFDPVSNIAALN